MQLPDESIEYHYQRSVAQPPGDGWTPLAELQAAHFVSPELLAEKKRLLETVRGRVAGERELANPPARDLPLQAGFIDLPQKLLDGFRRKGDASELGKITRIATRLRENCDRVIVLGAGGSSLAAKALFQALLHAYHNEMPGKMRLGTPRLYFDGDTLDNDGLTELLELLENTCVERDDREERWGAVAVSKSGGTMEMAAAFRAVRAEAAKYYGPKAPELKQLIVPVTGPKGKLRDYAKAEGYSDDDILTIPDEVSGRYSAFTPAGLLPAAVMGLDVRALLLGAAAMTKRFLEDPFDKNPVLQYAAVNHLLAAEHGKTTRVLAVWTRKLEALGLWHDHLVSESLGKAGKGVTPLTAVKPRDLHTRGQQHQDGIRDKAINNLYVRTPKHPAIMVGMSDRNEDDLNGFSRKGMPDLLEAAFKGTNQAYHEAARPTADIVMPVLSEHTMGQLMQMLMLATVVEGRLMGVNPYGQPGVEAYKRHTLAALKATPNLPKGELPNPATPSPNGGPRPSPSGASPAVPQG